MKSNLTFCISTYNNLPYLKLAVESVRKNSFYKDAPFIIHAENCTDGTNEWLYENKTNYNLTIIVEPDNVIIRGIGGGMNICADHVTTKYICFLHSDMIVTQEVIDQVRKGTFLGFFCVKRINMDNPLRKII